jgi:hypothetical protein
VGEGVQEPFAYVTPADEIERLLTLVDSAVAKGKTTENSRKRQWSTLSFTREFGDFLESEGFSATLSRGELKGMEFKPGTPVAVAFIFGDFSLGAGGTVTLVKGKKFVLFSHGLLGSWSRVSLPVLPARVDAVLPSIFGSTKVMVYGSEVLGSTVLDTDYGVAGVLGVSPPLFDLYVEYRGEDRSKVYRAKCAGDPTVASIVVSGVVSSAINVVSENGATLPGKPVRLEVILKKARDGSEVSSSVLLTDANLLQFFGWVSQLSRLVELFERRGEDFSMLVRVEVVKGENFAYFSPSSVETYGNSEGGFVVLRGNVVNREGDGEAKESVRTLRYEGEYQWLCWGNGCIGLANKLDFSTEEEREEMAFRWSDPTALWLVRTREEKGNFGGNKRFFVECKKVEVSELSEELLLLASSGLVRLRSGDDGL